MVFEGISWRVCGCFIVLVLAQKATLDSSGLRGPAGGSGGLEWMRRDEAFLATQDLGRTVRTCQETPVSTSSDIGTNESLAFLDLTDRVLQPSRLDLKRRGGLQHGG